MVKVTQSTTPKSAKTIHRKWCIIDVKGQVLGRAANEIATMLIGKRKVDYVPYLDNGDHVVVINASKVHVSGKKMNNKMYQNYSGYPGGLREVSMKRLLVDSPEKVLRHAISGMLPKNKLRDRRLTRLHIFPTEEHPYKDRISS